MSEQTDTDKPVDKPAVAYTHDLVSYTVPEFCIAHHISIAFYYKLKRQGRAPREMELGTRRTIAGEEAVRWRAQRTAKTEPA